MKHYKTQGEDMECFDMISSLWLDFAHGNVFKYLYRAGKKPGEPAAKDFAKAAHYMRLEANGSLYSASMVRDAIQRIDQPEAVRKILALLASSGPIDSDTVLRRIDRLVAE